MMDILRFPNPGSDLKRFISTFATIYNELKDKSNFTHDDTRDAAIKHGLVSSSGAIGAEAVRRSSRVDRSRDPLYNQLKMYSELYRMLGWLRPGTKNTNFNFTELSYYVAKSAASLQMRIFEECLLSIVFPNPLVENRNGNIIRPFPLILKLARDLEGVIFRDEIISIIYPLKTDRQNGIFDTLVASINLLRKSSKTLSNAKKLLSSQTGIMETTLENYTRFPLGSIKGTGWFESDAIKNIYEKRIHGYRLLEKGLEIANQYDRLIDFRHEDIEEFALETRGAFNLLSHYIFLERCGFDIIPYESAIEKLKSKASPILDQFKIKIIQTIFYSPAQQSTLEELEYANKLEESLLK